MNAVLQSRQSALKSSSITVSSDWDIQKWKVLAWHHHFMTSVTRIWITLGIWKKNHILSWKTKIWGSEGSCKTGNCSNLLWKYGSVFAMFSPKIRIYILFLYIYDSIGLAAPWFSTLSLIGPWGTVAFCLWNRIIKAAELVVSPKSSRDGSQFTNSSFC